MVSSGQLPQRLRSSLLAAVLAVASSAVPFSLQAAERSGECAQLLRTPDAPSVLPRRVLEPVPGLYEAALGDAAALRSAGWSVEERVTGGEGWGQASARLRHQPIQGLDAVMAHGELRRSAQLLSPSQGGGWLLELESAYLDDESPLPDGRILKLPRWVDLPGVPPLVPGRGIPAVTYFTLRQMRQLGIPYGGLRLVQLNEIANVATVFELAAALRQRGLTPMDLVRGQVPAEIMEETLRATHSVRYAETILVQSGHRIRGVSLRAGSGWLTSVEDVLDQVFSGASGKSQSRGYELAQQHGLKSDAPVLFEFDIRIEVEARIP